MMKMIRAQDRSIDRDRFAPICSTSVSARPLQIDQTAQKVVSCRLVLVLCLMLSHVVFFFKCFFLNLVREDDGPRQGGEADGAREEGGEGG
jgi:hypothetical protein